MKSITLYEFVNSFPPVSNKVLSMAIKHYEAFEEACEDDWPFGRCKKVWKDEDGSTCVSYEEGTWVHYYPDGTFR